MARGMAITEPARRLLTGGAILALAAAWPGPASARVTRFVVDAVTSPVFDGRVFGAVGRYERIRGHLEGEVDPAQAEDRLIQDIDLAPRDARGLVAYSADVLLYKPVDMAQASGVLHLDLPNRGRTLGLSYDVGAPRGEGIANLVPTSASDAGDGFLMRRGTTVLFVGWQGDLADGEGLLRLEAPIAMRDGHPVTGPNRVTITVDRSEPSVGIAGGGRPQVAYPAADVAESGAVLRHRGESSGPWTTVERRDWAFADCRTAPFPGTPDPSRLCLNGGLDPNQVYDLTYTATDARVSGLGLAALRDASAFFRHAAADDAGTPNPLAGRIRTVVATGESQDGNLMRNLVELGFTHDEEGRLTFDGMMAHLSGKRTPVDIRFGAPGATTTEFEGPLLPGHEAPLTWSSEPDPRDGVRRGLLDRCSATASCPRIFDTWTSTEYRQYAIAYTTLDPSGTRDLPLPPNVRAYFLAGSQHGTLDSLATPIPRGICAQEKNDGPNKESQRALLVAMEDWIRDGREPPPSRIATLAGGDLAAPGAIAWPAIPGVRYTDHALVPEPIDFGPGYDAPDQRGVLTLPPKPLALDLYRPLVPIVDRDGNETAGVRPTALQAPLGTYTGWNTRRAGFGEGELCGLAGSFIPFVRTKAERLASGDPRPSLEERYGTHDGYVAAVRAAAERLRTERLLLPEDADRLVSEAIGGPVLR